MEGGYERTGSRTPMQWSKGVNGDFSSAPSRMLYMAMDPDTDRPDAESQMAQEDSLYHWIQRLIALRKAYPCFGNDGYAEFVKAEKGCSPIVLKREKEGSCGYVVLNPFDQPLFVEDFGIDSDRTVDLPWRGTEKDRRSSAGDRCKEHGLAACKIKGGMKYATDAL